MVDMTPDGGYAILAGGLTKSDLENVVLPEAARQMTRVIAAECTQPVYTPCGCPPESGGELLESAFNINGDCAIATTELTTNTLVQALLTPDLLLDGERLLSFGIGVDLVPAAFTP